MQNRCLYIDILRIFATMMVVMIHCSGWFNLISPPPVQCIDTELFGLMSGCAVPVFFMISGALMLEPGYKTEIRKILYKILKIIIILFLWGVVYALADMKDFSLYKLLIWTYKGHFHFWFFEYLIGVYLLLPVLKALVEYKDGIYVKFALICWILFGVLKFTANGVVFYTDEIRIITSKIHYELVDFSGYFLLGHYLRNIDIRISKLLCTVTFVFCVFLQYIVSSYSLLNVSTNNFTILGLIESICLYMFFKDVSTMKIHGIWIINISSITLGVFLIHPLVLEHYMPNNIWYLPVIIRVIIVWLYVFLVSGIIVYLLKKIPFVNKWMLSI